MIFVKTDSEIQWKGDDGSITAYQAKSEPDTIIILQAGGEKRKITIKNITNFGEAIRDSLSTLPAFVKSSKALSAASKSFQEKAWPELDGKKLVPTFQNVDVEVLDLSPRALNALEKNDIMTLGEIPETLDEVKALRSIGATVALEVHEKKEEYFKNLLGKRKRKVTKKKKVTTRTSSAKKPKAQKKKVVSKSKRLLIIDSELQMNLKKLLMANMLAYVDEIPKTLEALLKLDKLGPTKAKQILEFIK